MFLGFSSAQMDWISQSSPTSESSGPCDPSRLFDVVNPTRRVSMALDPKAPGLTICFWQEKGLGSNVESNINF